MEKLMTEINISPRKTNPFNNFDEIMTRLQQICMQLSFIVPMLNRKHINVEEFYEALKDLSDFDKSYVQKLINIVDDLLKHEKFDCLKYDTYLLYNYEYNFYNIPINNLIYLVSTKKQKIIECLTVKNDEESLNVPDINILKETYIHECETICNTLIHLCESLWDDKDHSIELNREDKMTISNSLNSLYVLSYSKRPANVNINYFDRFIKYNNNVYRYLVGICDYEIDLDLIYGKAGNENTSEPKSPTIRDRVATPFPK